MAVDGVAYPKERASARVDRTRCRSIKKRRAQEPHVPRTGIAAVAVVVVTLLVAGCADDEPSASLPLVVHENSQDVPADPGGVFNEADLVVVASLESATPQRHYFGPDEEDPDPEVIEDVALFARVESTIKGEAQEGDLIEIAWSAYVGTDKSIAARTAQLVVGDVVLNENDFEGRYLFLLEEFGEPWGTKVLSDTAGVMEIDSEGNIGGQVSTSFKGYEGWPLERALADLSKR